ncbi:MAG: carbohydrate deacetylase [Candidatus Cyclobacteriaceae bacterium M3_2C_046]
MKKFIINADDFGLCPSVNEGIIHCYHQGLVSDFSFMYNKDHFDQSVTFFHESRIKACGLHVNLTVGKSLTGVNSLTDFSGNFRPLGQQMIKIITGAISEIDLYHEIKHQIKLLTVNQVKLSHLDSHQNIHLLPSVFKVLIKLNEEMDLNLPLRLPLESVSRFEGYTWGNAKRILVLNSLSLISKVTYKFKAPVTTVGGNFFNNSNPQKAFNAILNNIFQSGKDVFELAVHPGFVSPDILHYDTYFEGRKVELKFLENIQKNDLDQLQVVNFSELEFSNSLKNNL